MMKLFEVVAQKGTYAGVRFDADTNKAINQYMKDNSIPNAIKSTKLHTTLLYSRKHLPDYKPLGKIDPPLVATPGDFDVWKPTPEDSTEKPTRCLIVKIDCPALVERHEFLMEEYDATYDYVEYKTHITLSYNIGDMDISKLPKLSSVVKEINIVMEYAEELDLSWAKNKGTKK